MTSRLGLETIMGLIDTSKTERLEHPYEPGEWVEIRHLLAVEMDEARDIRVQRTMKLWGDTLDDLGDRASEEPPDTLANRIRLYDWLSLLKYAVVSWSYGPAREEEIERLDPITRDWLVEVVVQRNTRPLPSRTSSGENSKPATVLESWPI